MNKIKNFFEKKKLDNKFKQAGSGQRLNAAPQQASSSSKAQPPAVRHAPSSGASRAGEAALARLSQQQQTQQKKPASATATWKSKTEAQQIKQEIAAAEASRPLQPKQLIVKDHSLAVDGLFFTCPVYPACLPRNEIQAHLHECLLRDLPDEPLMISVTMIHTLNTDKTKKDACVTILGKYLQNILDNPGEEKYRKIRKGNKVFQEKVNPIIGVDEFLTQGVGFELASIPSSPGAEPGSNEVFYVMNPTVASNVDHIQTAKEMLSQAEGLEIVLDRNLKVFAASSKASQIAVPDSFYNITSDEAKRVQAQLTETVEKSKELRTKAMREADSGPKRVYRYCVIRIRFPDGILIQGTFKSGEKLSDVREFIKEQLAMEWLPFQLADTIGKPFPDETATLATLKLTPAALLNFRIDGTVVNEIAASSPNGKVQYLKEDVQILLQDL